MIKKTKVNKYKFHLIIVLDKDITPCRMVIRHFKDRVRRVTLVYPTENIDSKLLSEKIIRLKEDFTKVIYAAFVFHEVPLSDVSSVEKIAADIAKYIKLEEKEYIHINHSAETEELEMKVRKCLYDRARISQISHMLKNPEWELGIVTLG